MGPQLFYSLTSAGDWDMRGALQRVASSSRTWALAIVATLPIASTGVTGAAADLIKPSATIGKLHDLTGMR